MSGYIFLPLSAGLCQRSFFYVLKHDLCLSPFVLNAVQYISQGVFYIHRYVGFYGMRTSKFNFYNLIFSMRAQPLSLFSVYQNRERMVFFMKLLLFVTVLTWITSITLIVVCHLGAVASRQKSIWYLSGLIFFIAYFLSGPSVLGIITQPPEALLFSKVADGIKNILLPSPLKIRFKIFLYKIIRRK